MKINNTHFINGKWLLGTGPLFTSIDPANQEPIWQGREATSEEVKNAIVAAKEAFPLWSRLDITQRFHYMETFATTLSKNSEALALVISQETGKPLWEAKTEVAAMISKIAISKEAYHSRCPDVSKTLPNAQNITRHRPHGVLAILGPFNFPAHLPNGHIIPSLLAGNTIVFKPSELTPCVAQLTMELWEKIGIPPGVFNLVQGSAQTGHDLSTSPLIDGLLFTGSWATGRRLAEQFASTPNKILALEMGGNNPFIIGKIDDPTAAAYITIQSAFLTSGQRCTCARRLIIPSGDVGDAFLGTLIAMTKKICVGAYSETPEPFMGPLVNSKAAENVFKKQESLLTLGGISLLLSTSTSKSKAFVTPGIIDVTTISNRPDEEIFGPLLQVIRVPDFNAAIKEANNTKYGLAAGLLSTSIEEYQLFYREIRAGVLNWNTPLTGASSAAPFGGIGHSGNLRPSGYYAADYCAYPVASMETSSIALPSKLPPGISI